MAPLPPSSPAPFALQARGRAPRARALCIHGYTGSPYEVLPVALALADAGVAADGIVLPGHEGDSRVLDETPWSAWTRAAEEALLRTPRNAPCLLVGSSMGGLVALHLAAMHPDLVAGLILMAPALRFFPDGRAIAAAAQGGLWRIRRAIPKERRGGDACSPEARAMNPSYQELPLRGIGEVALLQAVVRQRLHLVRAPTCVFHGAQDHTIPAVASEIVCRSVSSARVEHHVLRDSWHLIGIDVDRDSVCALAVSFAQSVIHGHATAQPRHEGQRA